MVFRRRLRVPAKAVQVGAAVILGVSIGTLLRAETVLVPSVGAVPGLLAGAVGLLVGAGLYHWGPTYLATTGCGCAGDCDCS
ncbi:MAG: hypothetical protein ABEJ27_00125 [Halodesulfurarchaeum sp.]